MSEIPPVNPKKDDHYRAEYQVSPQFRKFWEHLFHGANLTDKEIHQLTDQFVKNISDNMNQVLNWALKQQKERDQREKGGD